MVNSFFPIRYRIYYCLINVNMPIITIEFFHILNITFSIFSAEYESRYITLRELKKGVLSDPNAVRLSLVK